MSFGGSAFKNGTMPEIKQEPIEADIKVEIDSDDDCNMMLGPSVLGLLRVGESPVQSPQKNPVVLNRRGIPARIRKKNRLFYDDDIVNTLSKPSPKRATVPRSPKKPEKKAPKPKETPAPRHQEPPPPPPPPPVQPASTPKASVSKAIPEPAETQTSPDRRLGQKIGMRLRNLLKLPKAHKWVCYEWFYSNIDKTLFEGDNDFMVCLRESFPQLRTRKLTRVEWCQMRRMMGKPRRCSVAFFEEERRELEQKRTKIRLLQQRKLTDLSSCRDLPDEIPLQLVIGTRVTARLRKPQDGLFTGSIDAVDTSNNTYRITFERPGLGTHSVPDYEVLSTEAPETISLSSFASKFRPRPSLQTSTPMSANISSILNSGLLGGDSSGHRSGMSGLPGKLLDTLVRLQKILNIKKGKIKVLRNLNADAERKKSFGEPITELFQKQYASAVIDLERLNADLQRYLTSMQALCFEIAPDPNTAALFTPSHLRDRSREDARQMLDKCRGTVHNEKMFDLITDLTALMLQVKSVNVQSLSEGDHSPYELKVVQGSMEQIRSRLSPANQQLFQNCVEIHLQHIQMGLGQRGAFTPFMSQRA
ncbi:protein lin-9 homolog [Thrips palmi]|uniref:Protein lin-9 homolog n=1 Tax=Thrips palmi TaxID=161013 RepID=A0A6P8YLQ8_THRPL|nr:protein lin-9 homolog [Thrips palmi]